MNTNENLSWCSFLSVRGNRQQNKQTKMTHNTEVCDTVNKIVRTWFSNSESTVKILAIFRVQFESHWKVLDREQ